MPRPSTFRRLRCQPNVDVLEGRALLTAGALDTTFGGTGLVTTPIQSGGQSAAIAVQSDLKVVVAGYSLGTSGPYHLTVARYNSDGTLDSTFGKGGVVIIPLSTASGDHAYAVAIQPADGKIVVAGDDWVAGKKGTTVDDWAVARLNTNGKLDTTFGGGAGYVLTNWVPPGSLANYDVASAIAIQSNGKIVVAGQASLNANSGGIGLARYNADGSLDTTFGTGGKVVNTGIIWSLVGQMVAIDSVGRIDAAGYTNVGTTAEMAVARYLTNGTLDTSFGAGGVVNVLPSGASTAIAKSLALQSTGKIVVYGQGNYSNSHNLLPTLVRLNTDGSLDSAFGIAGLYTESRMDYATSMVIQPADDKIVAVGDGWVNGTADLNFWVTRVLADGSSSDSTFGTNGLAEANFNNTSTQRSAISPVGTLAPDGKIVVTGSLGYPAPADFYTARFLGDSSSSPTSSAIAAHSKGISSDPVLGALVLDDPAFLNSLTSGKNRRTT